ncbi:MAG: NAD-dependent epimerase/dehydratase family protein [Candidatus Heimdallarchaeota archaeon]
MKISSLVTGGAGFIGTHLCRRLLKENQLVICLDNLSSGSERNIEGMVDDENFLFFKGDTKDETILQQIFSDYSIEAVYHLAAIVGVKKTLENPLDVLEDVLGIRNLLRYSQKHGTDKFVYTSSSEVYGEPPEIPEKEEGLINPHTPYSAVKLLGEKYCEAYYEEFGLETTSLRLFNVYGPQQDSSPYGFVVGIFIEQVLDGKNLTIFGDGTQTRDFVFVEDTIEAIFLSSKTSKAAGKVINIGTGRPVTILDLAENIIRLMKKSDIQMEFRPLRKDEVKHRFPDVSKMKEILNFNPRIGLNEGLQRTIEWYQNKTDFL